MDKAENLKRLQGSMMFLAGVANGLDDLVGRGAPGITFRAGISAGLKSKVEKQQTDLMTSFDIMRDELKKMGIYWNFKLYKKQSEKDYYTETEDGINMKIIFTDCMVRSCQFHYGYPQKNSLCMLQHGIMCGLLQKVYGAWTGYNPIHSGENACIGMLIIKNK